MAIALISIPVSAPFLPSSVAFSRVIIGVKKVVPTIFGGAGDFSVGDDSEANNQGDKRPGGEGFGWDVFSWWNGRRVFDVGAAKSK